MQQFDNPVRIGKVTGTHGIRGQLRVSTYSGDAEVLLAVDAVLLGGSQGLERFEVARAAVHGKKILLTLKGFDDINAVEKLVGREVFVPRGDFPALGDDEYYWHDLLGLTVATPEGETLGELAQIIETGSNDVYVVRCGRREYLVPATDEVVREIDLDSRRMIVVPLEGMLDL